MCLERMCVQTQAGFYWKPFVLTKSLRKSNLIAAKEKMGLVPTHSSQKSETTRVSFLEEQIQS